MKIILVGQPNSGKSTVFNWMGGYKSVTANFPGTTVSYTAAKTRLNGWRVEVVDLPGIYSLAATDAASAAALEYLLLNGKRQAPEEVLVNVVDASRLTRALELTLDLLELGRPMVLCLNMIDEARRRGLRLDLPQLTSRLGIPVVATIASRGQGLKELASEIRQAVQPPKIVAPPSLPPPIQQAVEQLASSLNGQFTVMNQPFAEMNFPARLLFLKLLENNPTFVDLARQQVPQILPEASRQRLHLKSSCGQHPEQMIAADRLDRAKQISDRSTEVGQPQIGWRDRLDQVLMHPVWGYALLVFILYAFFNVIFKIGAGLEPVILGFFEKGTIYLQQMLGKNALIAELLTGTLQGLAAGVAIVLPYLVPFLFGMALLEDFGYLPRVAFLMDGLLHRIGLHGTSVFPAILGYGCSVPAVMATRILRSPRDRFIAAILAVMIPCSARTTVILGLVAFYLSPNAALLIYLVNIVVIAAAGKVLTKIWPEITPGMIMEIPPYRLPSPRLLIAKTWWRLKEFIVIAWPLLIAGSVALSLAEHWQLDQKINAVLRPLTGVLGLPLSVGTTLIFGVMRKELSMLMLMQALGTTNVAAMMTSLQIVIFTLFVVFYIPCLATITVLWKEIGSKRTILAIGLTMALAVGISLVARSLLWTVGVQ